MNNKKPRIAFCFSWQARTLDQTYQLFQKNLFDAAKEQWFEYDIFCAVENDVDLDKVNLLNPTKIEKIRSSEVEKVIEKKYGEFIKNDLKNYWYVWKDWCAKFLQQMYKISQSMKLKINFEVENNVVYDIVFKLRFDCPFPRKLNFKEIYNDIHGKRVVLCNRQRMIPTLILTTKIEDMYFILDNESSNILWNIFEDWDLCFKWHEIKNLKFANAFEKIDKFLSKRYRCVPLSLICLHLYALFYTPFHIERQFLSYFQYNNLTVNKKVYITIWIIRDDKKYKKSDFRTHSKRWMFKKWKYEI